MAPQDGHRLRVVCSSGMPLVSSHAGSAGEWGGGIGSNHVLPGSSHAAPGAWCSAMPQRRCCPRLRKRPAACMHVHAHAHARTRAGRWTTWRRRRPGKRTSSSSTARSRGACSRRRSRAWLGGAWSRRCVSLGVVCAGAARCTASVPQTFVAVVVVARRQGRARADTSVFFAWYP